MSNVFISSTGKDLVKYRQAAIEICNRLGMVPNAMEFFEAMGVGATEGSQRQLDEADVYVGIFAHRYGFIEDGYDKAVTEIEFDYAGERGIARLCFLLADDFSWPPAMIDHAHYGELQTFKERINTTHIRAEFTTVDDFKFKLMQALVAWQKEHTPEGPPDPHGFIPHQDIYIPRGQIETDVRQRLAAQGVAAVVGLHAPGGVGKTELAKRAAADLQVDFETVLWLDLGAKPPTQV